MTFKKTFKNIALTATAFLGLASQTDGQTLTTQTGFTTNNAPLVSRQYMNIQSENFNISFFTNPQNTSGDTWQVNASLPKSYALTCTKIDEEENNDQYIFDLYKSVTVSNIDIAFDAGTGFKQGDWQWVLASVSHEKFHSVLALIDNNGLFDVENELQKEFSGFVSAHHNGAYLAVGSQGFEDIAKPRLMAGYTSQNAATNAFLKLNPNDHSWSITSTSALGKLDEDMFSSDHYNTFYMAEHTAAPFIANVLPKSVEAGTYNLMVSAQGNEHEMNTTILPGIQTTIVDFGVGTTTHTTYNENTKLGLQAVVSKTFSLAQDKLKGTLNVEYNSLTQEANGFVQINYTW
jgi:hypothetical protein